MTLLKKKVRNPSKTVRKVQKQHILDRTKVEKTIFF